MNHLTENHKPTMTSREIAELTGKRHGDVIRDIRSMIDEMEDDADLRHVVDVKDPRGYTAEFLLDRFHTEVLVTGYDVKRRAAVIKRWFDLETSAAKPAFQVPQSMAEALRLAADQAERIEQQQAAIEQARPSVEFVERYVSADSGNKGFRQVAKLLKANERDLRAFLSDHKIMYRLAGEWMPYQNHVDAGRFVVKTGVAENEHAFNTAKFTPKGINWLASLWNGQRNEVAA
jgi:phage antirepressor YoqD-like protein